MIAGLLVGAVLAGCTQEAVVSPASAPSDPLLALNTQARANYAASRAVLLQRQRPAIFIVFDEAVLMREGAEQVRQGFTPPLYDRYKQVSHLPLGLWATLAPWVDRPQSSDWQASLQALIERGEAARDGLDKAGFPADRLARQRQIIDTSLVFAKGVLDRGNVSAADLRQWARNSAPLVLANADDAAAAQIDGLHAVITRWRRELLSPTDWQRVYVIILGPKMPRADNVSQQYFERVMGRTELGHRLIYAEGIFDLTAAGNLLGTIATDRRLATDFFGAEMRMDRDFLGDGARRRLDAIFGRQ